MRRRRQAWQHQAAPHLSFGRRTACDGLNLQALHDLPVHQVFVDDLIDVFLVQLWAGTESVALYNAVFRLVDALRLFPAAVVAVALPSLPFPAPPWVASPLGRQVPARATLFVRRIRQLPPF